MVQMSGRIGGEISGFTVKVNGRLMDKNQELTGKKVYKLARNAAKSQ